MQISYHFGMAVGGGWVDFLFSWFGGLGVYFWRADVRSVFLVVFLVYVGRFGPTVGLGPCQGVKKFVRVQQ